MILVVDDEAENRASLVAALNREGWPCIEAASGNEALEILRNNLNIRLLITDLKMPGGLNGLELLQSARIIRPEVQRLLVTAFGTIEDTVTAMKSGAFDVLPKPLKLKSLKETVAKLLERAPSQSSVPKIETVSRAQISPAYCTVTDTLRRAALSEANVLFTGESGCGKTYLARVLHESSARRDGPFVALNCAAIPEDLLESELFGFEKGAFTGAVQSRDGKILAANGGTLLLDEIGDLSPALQAKLLQFIQDKKFFKLGSNREIVADVRILSATHQALDTLILSGRFREDLLYRLKVVEIKVPPLRERKEDLFWLVPGLLDVLCEKNKIAKVRLTQNALAKIWAYDWPGNIRELENVLESCLVLAPTEEIREGFLSEKTLPEKLKDQKDEGEMPKVTDLATIEKMAIRQTLLLTNGNKKLTASLLGISERTLYRTLEGDDRV